jgi:hypothetical protein
MSISGKIEKNLRRMFLEGDGQLTIGVGGLADVESGQTKSGSLRVAMHCNGMAIFMTSAEARAIAPRYETSEGVAAGCDWIGRTLREVADEIDARPPQQEKPE